VVTKKEHENRKEHPKKSPRYELFDETIFHEIILKFNPLKGVVTRLKMSALN